MKRSPQAGFRLLDLLLVVVILGVPFLVAFPTISRITAHSRVNQAAMVVVHDLLLRVSAPTASRPKSHDSTKDSRLLKTLGFTLIEILAAPLRARTPVSTRPASSGTTAYQVDSVTTRVALRNNPRW